MRRSSARRRRPTTSRAGDEPGRVPARGSGETDSQAASRERGIRRARAFHEAPGQFRHLRPEDLRRFRNMLFRARTIVEGFLSGRHRSPYYGSSAEFSDHREYAPGDEPRFIDWRVVARTDKHYVKLFEEETDMVSYIVLDRSGSMAYPERKGELTKIEYGSYLAAALAYLMVRQGDRVGFAGFDESIRDFIPSGGTTGHLYAILHRLEEIRTGSKTHLGQALRQLFPLLTRRGLIVLISDLLDDPASIFDALNMYTYRRFDVLIFQVLHPDERNLPDVEEGRFVDIETGESVVASPEDAGPSYRSAMSRHIGLIRDLATARMIDHKLLDTRAPYYRALEGYLGRRARLRKRWVKR